MYLEKLQALFDAKRQLERLISLLSHFLMFTTILGCVILAITFMNIVALVILILIAIVIICILIITSFKYEKTKEQIVEVICIELISIIQNLLQASSCTKVVDVYCSRYDKEVFSFNIDIHLVDCSLDTISQSIKQTIDDISYIADTNLTVYCRVI